MLVQTFESPTKCPWLTVSYLWSKIDMYLTYSCVERAFFHRSFFIRLIDGHQMEVEYSQVFAFVKKETLWCVTTVEKQSHLSMKWLEMMHFCHGEILQDDTESNFSQNFGNVIPLGNQIGHVVWTKIFVSSVSTRNLGWSPNQSLYVGVSHAFTSLSKIPSRIDTRTQYFKIN